jgi:hypothetical protein
LKLNSMIWLSRKERHIGLNSGMEPNTGNGHRLLNGLLLVIERHIKKWQI